MASVNYRAGRTVALPGFENIKLDFEASTVVRKDETYDQAWDRVVAKVDARLNRAVKQVQDAVALADKKRQAMK